METQSIVSFDGLKLHTIYLSALVSSKATPTILWVHGAFEYTERYLPIMQHFAELGYNAIGVDLRGHGRSGGTRMYIRSMDDYLRDVTAAYKAYADRITGPLFLVGHSMGGLVALRHRQAYPNALPPLTATVLSCPFLGVKVKLPAWKTTLSKVVVSIYPRLGVPADLSPDLLTHDPAVNKAYAEDPLVQKVTTAGWFESLLKAHKDSFADAARTPGPLHFMVASDDGLVDAARAEALYRQLPANMDKSWTWFEGYYHEIFNEVGKQKAYDKLAEILSRYQ